LRGRRKEKGMKEQKDDMPVEKGEVHGRARFVGGRGIFPLPHCCDASLHWNGVKPNFPPPHWCIRAWLDCTV